MEEIPRISVILPVYNVELYLRRAVDSLLQQTWPNMEIILVDDGSQDDSGEICDSYANCPNISIIHQKNAGVSAARNSGLRIANGDYIGFVDPDDYVTSDMYEFLYKTLQQTNADIAVCCHDYYYGEKKIIYDNMLFHDVLSAEQALIREVHYSLFMTCNKLFSRSCINGVFYHEEYINGEDRLFAIEAICQSQRVAYNMESKYHYCHRSDSAGTKSFTPRDYKLIELCGKIRDIFCVRIPDALPVAESQITSAYIQLLDMMQQNSNEYPKYRQKLVHGLRKRWWQTWYEPTKWRSRIKIVLYSINPNIAWKVISMWRKVKS